MRLFFPNLLRDVEVAVGELVSKGAKHIRRTATEGGKENNKNGKLHPPQEEQAVTSLPGCLANQSVNTRSFIAFQNTTNIA